MSPLTLPTRPLTFFNDASGGTSTSAEHFNAVQDGLIAISRSLAEEAASAALHPTDIGFGAGQVMSGQARLDQIAAPTADMAFGAHKFSFGTGDLLGGRVTTPPAAHVLDVRDGIAGSPTKIGVTASYSRTDATSRTEVNAMGPVGTDGPDGATVIRASIKGAATSQVQIVGVFSSAWQTGESNGGEASADACAIYGFGRTSNNAVGRAIAAYFESSRETTTSAGQQALELRVSNKSGVSDSYVVGGPSKSMGLWLNAGGTADSAAALQVGASFGHAFDVGAGFVAGSVLSATVLDATNSKVSLDIRGEHEKAITVASKAGPVLIGGQSSLSAGALLEVQGIPATTYDPIMRLSTTTASAIGIRMINASGSMILGVSGGANQFATGSVTGDIALRVGAAGAKLFLCEVGGAPKMTISTTGLAFYGGEPVVRGEVTGSRGGNAALASLLEKLNLTLLIKDGSTA